MATQYAFALVNVLGGLFVLGSYIWGLSSYPEHRETLWGGISGAWRVVFFASMLLAAVGYLAFGYYEFFRSGARAYQETGILGPYMLSIISAVFLLAATVWMPSTLAYINTHQVSVVVIGKVIIMGCRSLTVSTIDLSGVGRKLWV